MKKKTEQKQNTAKLNLQKQTIVNLSARDMMKLYGGKEIQQSGQVCPHPHPHPTPPPPPPPTNMTK